MSERVTLPPGCAGFTTADGRTLKAKAGTSIVLDDRDAAVLKRSEHASIGLVTSQSFRLGTRDGRWCEECRRLWQGWSLQCPKCDALTVPEGRMNDPLDELHFTHCSASGNHGLQPHGGEA